MGKRKSIVAMGVTMLLIIGVVIGNVLVTQAATNEQAGTVRKRSTPVEMVFYNFQSTNLNVDDVSRKNPLYKELTRADLFDKTQYLAFDSEGYLVPFADIIIDQNQLDTINNDINMGVDLFKNARKTKPGNYISYPFLNFYNSRRSRDSF
ncbi:MAG: hypothetical protein ACK5LC_01950 [Coprobacillaceae bacterium]